MTSREQRVFVTGVGAITSAGVGADELWRACLDGRNLVVSIPETWGPFYRANSRVWAPLVEPDFGSFGVRKSEELLLSRPALIGIASSQLALLGAGLHLADERTPAGGNKLRDIPSGRLGVFIGTGLGGARSGFDNYTAHLLGGMKRKLQALYDADPDDHLAGELVAALRSHPRVNPMVICQTMPNALAANIALRYCAQGAVETYCAACASGTVALGKAYRALRCGELEMAFAGGIEHLSDRAGGVFMGFDRLQTLATPFTQEGSENRPFDADRRGFLFSEGGAGIVVLESGESVRRRAAESRVLAEVIGFGQSNDAFSIAAVSQQHNTFNQMLQAALGDAGLDSTAIDYINTHGTATALNDATEAEFIKEFFGRRPYLNSTKSILGHSIGAAGALEFIVTALSLRHQMVHGTRNLENPIADLNFATETGPALIEHALTQNFGFGGHNAALVLKRFNGSVD